MTAWGRVEDPSIAALYSRAAQAAGMPLAVHVSAEDSEGERLLGSWGHCQACTYVNSLPVGKSACREDRQRAAAMARKLGQPVSFVCHMGFGCTALAPDVHEDTSITLGPWCPQGNDQALAFDACRGLAKLTGQPPRDHFPTSLDDIHRCPTGVAEAVLNWLKRDLEAASRPIRDGEVDAAQESDDVAVLRKERFRNTQPPSGANSTTVLVAAALAGNRAQVREALEASLAELKRSGKPTIAVKYLHLLGNVFEATAALESRGVATASIYTELLGGATLPLDEAAFRQALLRCSRMLSQLSRVEDKRPTKAKPTNNAPRPYPALDVLLRGRLADPPALGEVAEALGKSPAAITRQLQRDIGLSYTGYVGKLRIESAKELLRRTKLPIETIARRMGFSDTSNFRRSFKQFAGVGPAAYREQFGKK